jgi:hypothetical protein
MKTKAVLQELFDLLEAYAPSWFTEEQRDRAVTALQHTDKPELHLVKPAPPARSGASEPTESASVERRYRNPDTGTYLQ